MSLFCDKWYIHCSLEWFHIFVFIYSQRITQIIWIFLLIIQATYDLPIEVEPEVPEEEGMHLCGFYMSWWHYSGVPCDMILYNMIRYDMVWYGMIWYYIKRNDMICFDMMWYDMIWFDMIHYDVIWYDVIWHDVIWHDMILYDMICFDMIWYDVICFDMI